MKHANHTPQSPLTCAEFDALVPDLLEDALDAGACASAEAHASNCARCAGLLSDLKELRTEAARLPVLKPSRDLWKDIDARIETPVIAFAAAAVARQRTMRMRIAAAAVILVAVTATATWKIARMATHADQAVPSPAVAVLPSEPVAVDPVAFRLASAYDSEIDALRRRLAERPGGLDSATARVVAANFRVIDDAIKRVRIALDSAPANALLSQQLARAYEVKLNTLRQIAALQTD